MRALAAAAFAVAAWACATSAAAACLTLRPREAQRLEIGTRGRPVWVRLPAGSASAAPAPLVVLLHGSTGSGEQVLRNSGLTATADRHGFVLIAPDGGVRLKEGFAWAIPGVPTVSGPLPKDAPDDAAHVVRAVDALAAARCIDPSRVYATGISGGGRMASFLACRHAVRFAAIAPVVGLRAGAPAAGEPARPDPASCRPSRPVPILAFAGDADTTNPIEGGGAPYWRYSMHDALRRWAAIDGCQAAPTTRWVARAVYEERYAACRDGAEVAARITVGGKHVWLADNEAMWAFFDMHGRDPRHSASP